MKNFNTLFFSVALTTSLLMYAQPSSEHVYVNAGLTSLGMVTSINAYKTYAQAYETRKLYFELHRAQDKYVDFSKVLKEQPLSTNALKRQAFYNVLRKVRLKDLVKASKRTAGSGVKTVGASVVTAWAMYQKFKIDKQ